MATSMNGQIFFGNLTPGVQYTISFSSPYFKFPDLPVNVTDPGNIDTYVTVPDPTPTPTGTPTDTPTPEPTPTESSSPPPPPPPGPGGLKWSFPTGMAIKSAPAIGSDGTIYVGSHNGTIYALYGTGSSLGGWPMFHQNLLHTGLLS